MNIALCVLQASTYYLRVTVQYGTCRLQHCKKKLTEMHPPNNNNEKGRSRPSAPRRDHGASFALLSRPLHAG